MKKCLPLLIVSSCFALGSCKDVRLGASGVDAGGGNGGGAGSTGGVAGSTGGVTGTGGTGGTDATTACRAPSPDYGPTSVFRTAPEGTPAATADLSRCLRKLGVAESAVLPISTSGFRMGRAHQEPPTARHLAEVPCACRSTTGPVDGFNCSCEGGTWICRIIAQGTAVCEPCPDVAWATLTGPTTQHRDRSRLRHH